MRLKSKQEWDHGKHLDSVSDSELLNSSNQNCGQFQVTLTAEENRLARDQTGARKSDKRLWQQSREGNSRSEKSLKPKSACLGVIMMGKGKQEV